VEREVGSELGVDFRFVFAGQFLLAHADQTHNEFFSTGMSYHHLSHSFLAFSTSCYSREFSLAPLLVAALVRQRAKFDAEQRLERPRIWLNAFC
jgi:hypothetical protein